MERQNRLGALISVQTGGHQPVETAAILRGRERKLEVAKKIYDIVVGEYGLAPEDLATKCQPAYREYRRLQQEEEAWWRNKFGPEPVPREHRRQPEREALVGQRKTEHEGFEVIDPLDESTDSLKRGRPSDATQRHSPS